MTDYLKLARMLAMSPGRAGAQFGGQMTGGPPPTPPVSIRATPPGLPQFQIPGMNMMPNYGGGSPQPQAAPPMPPPMAVSTPPGMGGPQPMNVGGAPPPLPPSMQIGMAPGMGQSPTSIDEWRRALDAAQFARQGQ